MRSKAYRSEKIKKIFKDRLNNTKSAVIYDEEVFDEILNLFIKEWMEESHKK